MSPPRKRGLRRWPEDRLAAALRVSVPEHRQFVDGLSLRVDWRRLRLCLAPVRDETSLQEIKRALARLWVLADHE
jgi:hypothetical protein